LKEAYSLVVACDSKEEVLEERVKQGKLERRFK
jgi:hypothetical protein